MPNDLKQTHGGELERLQKTLAGVASGMSRGEGASVAFEISGGPRSERYLARVVLNSNGNARVELRDELRDIEFKPDEIRPEPKQTARIFSLAADPDLLAWDTSGEQIVPDALVVIITLRAGQIERRFWTRVEAQPPIAADETRRAQIRYSPKGPLVVAAPSAPPVVTELLTAMNAVVATAAERGTKSAK